MIRPQPHIAAMAPYETANTTAPAGVAPIALAQNESLRQPSPRAIAAARAALSDGALYPDPECAAVREAIAGIHNVPAEHVLCGAGSLDLIGALARVYAGPDQAVLIPAHAYPFFRTAALMVGARVDTAPEDGYTLCVSSLLQAVQPDTALVFVANPANPTGTRVGKSELERLHAGLRPDILLVIDEAYGEFADHLDAPTFDMVRGGGTCVLRTFSKAYGLAGLRVGWGLLPPHIAAELRKVLNPNAVSAPAQAAATAALEDQPYMRETCRITAKLRTEFVGAASALGLTAIPSHTNFGLIDFGTATTARAAEAYLRSRGIIVRAQGGAGLPQCLRLTLGPADAMHAALTALTTWREEHAE